MVLILGLFTPGLASAAIIDFNAAVGSPNGYSELGVNFSYLGTGSNFFGTSPNSTRAITMSGGDTDGQMRADITGGASTVSVDLGDFNADPDRLILSIYDSLDNLLGSVTQDISASFVGMVTLSLSAANIAYATFGTTGDLGRGGIYADNFTFDGDAAVPVPGVLFLFAIGLLALGVARRRS